MAPPFWELVCFWLYHNRPGISWDSGGTYWGYGDAGEATVLIGTTSPTTTFLGTKADGQVQTPLSDCLVSVFLHTNLLLYISDFPGFFCAPSFKNAVFYGFIGESG